MYFANEYAAAAAKYTEALKKKKVRNQNLLREK